MNSYYDDYDPDQYLSEEELAEKKKTDYTQLADAIWNRTKALGLPDDDETVRDVYDHLSLGRPDRAMKKLQFLESKKARMIDNEVESRVNARLGNIEGDVKESSPGGGNDEQWFTQEYGTGKSDDHERARKYMEAQQNAPVTREREGDIDSVR